MSDEIYAQRLEEMRKLGYDFVTAHEEAVKAAEKATAEEPNTED